MAPRSASRATGTPGRQAKPMRSNQYFDVGKVGRKTGITLVDTGVRDEYGLEPVAGIFSSPAKSSPWRRELVEEVSGSMEMQDSSAPSVDATLHLRKTPRLPPPRGTTPRKSGIAGSPKRMSTGRTNRHQSVPLDDSERDSSPRTGSQPPPNRVLEFGRSRANGTVEMLSPFKPRKTLRRSTGAVRPDPFALPEDSEQDEGTGMKPTTAGAQDYLQEVEKEGEPNNEELPVALDDGPLMIDDDSFSDSLQGESREESAGMDEMAPLSSPSRRKRGAPRASGDSVLDWQAQPTPPGRKRARTSLDQENTVNEGNTSFSQTPGDNYTTSAKRKSIRSSKTDSVIVHGDNGDRVVDVDQIAAGDEYEAPITVSEEGTENAVETVEEVPKKGRAKKGRKGKPKAPPRTKPVGSPVKLNESPSRLREQMSPSKRRGGSMGPVSNVNLRASTPFEDAGSRVSRYGRPVMQPLKYWEGENYIWRCGEVEGVIRAEDVQQIKAKPKGGKKKGGQTTKKRRKGAGLPAVEEELSETESVQPDEWEEEVGVLAGMVAAWDPETGMGDSDQPIQEDLAFSAPSIVTRDVANSAFTYAKIMTLPFFGSGVVELPPEGFKRAKNSRRMQMVFFVHEGKVLVQVGGTAGVQGAGGDGLGEEFAISKGGVWVVPRGNNYAITNESRTKTARIFFAQGCEVAAAAAAG